MRLDEIEPAVAAAQKRLDKEKDTAAKKKQQAKEYKARVDKTEDLLSRRDAGRRGQAIRKAMVLPPSVVAALKT